MRLKLFITTVLVFSSILVNAQTTWNGSANSNWNDAANWSSGLPNTTTAAIIPAAGTVTNWPKLNVDANIAALTMGEGSSMDVNGFFITIYSGGLNLNGGTVPITITNSSSVTNIAFTSATGSTGNWLIGNVIFMDQVVYSIMGTGIFYDGNTGGATVYKKDVSYIIQNTGNAFICTYFPNVYEGNVGVIRNAATSTSITNIFVSGHAGIAGHFTLNNTVGGITSINPSGSTVDTIQGAVNITLGRSGSLQHQFVMQGIVNNSGGNINIANVTKLIISGNTLNTPVSISGLALSTENTIRGNRITGNFSIEHTVGTHASINTGGNKFNGNAIFNLVGGELNTGYSGFGADTVNGNTSFTLGDEERLVESHSFKNKYNGNLTVNRTGTGNTYLFKSGHDGISGDLNIYNSNINTYGGGAVVEINPDGVSLAAIAGTVDVNMEAIRPNDLWFAMRGITNNTAGGEIKLTNATKINFVNNLLRATCTISGLAGSTENNFFGNNISGNFTLESTTGNHAPVYFGSNLLTGNTSFNLSGGQLFTGYTGYGADIYTGNTTITLGVGETLNESQGYPNKYNGNLTVTRSGAGLNDNINLFISGHAGISGNFSFTNLHAYFGEDYINRNNNPTNPIQGMINIDVNLGTAGSYQLFQMKGIVNNTAGGTINIANQADVSLQNNTLKADINITSLRLGGWPITINGNNFTGNFLLNNLDGIQVYTGGNQFNGTTSFMVTNGNLFTGYPGLGADKYNGNTNITIGNWANLFESYNYGNQYNGNLTINRTGISSSQVTILFNAGHVAISGNFTFSNPHGGYITLNQNGSASALIQGTVNIDVSNALEFRMRGVSNNTAGGTITINNCGSINMSKDTLLANVAVTNITGSGDDVFYQNKITGSFTLSDDIANGAGIFTGGNTIIGATAYTLNSAASFNTSAEGQGKDIHNGSFSLTRNGTGSFVIAKDNDVEWNGDVILNYPSFVNYNPANKIIIGGSNSSIQQLGTAAVLIPNLQLNKSSGTALTLNSPLYISNNLDLSNGIINSNTTNFLQLNDNATVTGAGTASNVNGVVQKAGDDAFSFPIGTATTFNPVAMSAPAGASDIFSAEYKSGNPYNPASHAATVAKVSDCEHWIINRLNGSSNVTLTFTYDQPCAGPGYVTNPANVHIVHWNGNSWDDLGNGGYSGGLTGTVTTAGPVSSFSPFTIASTHLILNPLPLTLLSFTAQPAGNTVKLNWATSNEINVSHFEIERSSDGVAFSKIGVVNSMSASNTNNYNYVDATPQNGTNFYRLKMLDMDGRFEFSKIVNVHFSSEHLVRIYPVPASTTITLQGANQFKQLEIVDMQGRILLRKNISLQNETINISSLAKGMYLIKLSNGKKTVSEKFVKE